MFIASLILILVFLYDFFWAVNKTVPPSIKIFPTILNRGTHLWELHYIIYKCRKPWIKILYVYSTIVDSFCQNFRILYRIKSKTGDKISALTLRFYKTFCYIFSSLICTARTIMIRFSEYPAARFFSHATSVTLFPTSWGKYASLFKRSTLSTASTL